MAAISACIDSWNWEDLLVSGLVPSIGNQTLPSLFRRSSTSPIPFLRFFLLDTHPSSTLSQTWLLATLLGLLSLERSRIARASLAPPLHEGGLRPTTCYEISRGQRPVETSRKTIFPAPFPERRSMVKNGRRNYESSPLVCFPPRVSSSFSSPPSASSSSSSFEITSSFLFPRSYEPNPHPSRDVVEIVSSVVERSPCLSENYTFNGWKGGWKRPVTFHDWRIFFFFFIWNFDFNLTLERYCFFYLKKLSKDKQDSHNKINMNLNETK